MTEKPCPKATEETRPFWTSAARGELSYQSCMDCRTPLFPPGTLCRRCGSTRLEWQVSSGLGTIYSLTMVHRAPTPAFVGDVPYALALVDVAEGFRMMANIVGCDPLVLDIGTAVKVVFEARGEEILIPQFSPV